MGKSGQAVRLQPQEQQERQGRVQDAIHLPTAQADPSGQDLSPTHRPAPSLSNYSPSNICICLGTIVHLFAVVTVDVLIEKIFKVGFVFYSN